MAAGTVADPAARGGHEVDVAAFGTDAEGRERLLALGEVKWSDTMGLGHLRRLRHIRDLLTARGTATVGTRLLCFSGTGFTNDLREAAVTDPAIHLVDAARLYDGA